MMRFQKTIFRKDFLIPAALLFLFISLGYAASQTDAAKYAQLANWAYGPPDNLTDINGDTWEIISEIHSPSGLDAFVFKNPRTGEIVISFAGTNPSQWADIVTDIENALGLPSDQYFEALRFAMMIKNLYPGKKITITGHSLGGGLAQYTAASLGLDAFTYNAAELGSSLLGNLDKLPGVSSQIINYRSTGDPVSIANLATTGKSLGTDVHVPTPFTYDINAAFELLDGDGTPLTNPQDISAMITLTNNMLDAHSMDILADFLIKQAKASKTGPQIGNGPGVSLADNPNPGPGNPSGTSLNPGNTSINSNKGWVNPNKDWENQNKNWKNPNQKWENPNKDWTPPK